MSWIWCTPNFQIENIFGNVQIDDGAYIISYKSAT